MSEVKKILLIDDERVMRQILRDFFKKDTEYEFQAVENCADADKLLLEYQEEFDLILLDLMMPDKGGIQYLDDLAKRESNIPVIVITGFGTVDTCRKSFLLGVSDYIMKPFKVDELLQAIESVFQNQSVLSQN